MKKSNAGKFIILGLIFACIATAVILKQVFQQSASFKTMATEQMRMEFLSYVELKTTDSKLQVASLNGVSYFADLKAPWSLSIHDKTLILKAPELTPAPAADIQAQVHEVAKKTIGDAAMVWLEDKFHTKKDLLVEVNF